MSRRVLQLAALALAFRLGAFNPASAEDRELAVEAGEKIAFMGDSITQAGARKNGYVTLVREALPTVTTTATARPTWTFGTAMGEPMRNLLGGQ